MGFVDALTLSCCATHLLTELLVPMFAQMIAPFLNYSIFGVLWYQVNLPGIILSEITRSQPRVDNPLLSPFTLRVRTTCLNAIQRWPTRPTRLAVAMW